MEALTSTGMGRKPTDEKSLVTKRSTSCVIISTHRKADHVRFGLPVLGKKASCAGAACCATAAAVFLYALKAPWRKAPASWCALCQRRAASRKRARNAVCSEALVGGTVFAPARTELRGEESDISSMNKKKWSESY
ncbi:hypothetical protein NPIL_394481 [Nephila pilipes]|uniref:Uncharacterized protein n=1 Tax=Nephila pilipes TaxID=299642 RepID=A0A8X6MXN2_NEPPI|nr:hypothetical protein NPIL_394481 [Nephila pilipes]